MTHCTVCDWSEESQRELDVSALLPIFLPMTGGQFMMGSPMTETGRDPDEDQHLESVAPFWVANVEVTQLLFVSVTKHNPTRDKHPLKPIASVTWWEAIQFCNQLSKICGYTPVYEHIDTDSPSANLEANGFRLPTEAEWEWMARSCNQEVPLHQQATDWSTNSTEPATAQLQWVLGNVWEMCWDLYAPYTTHSKLVGSSIPEQARVVRGGSWVDGIDIFRPANRGFVDPHSRTDTIGFRLVRTHIAPS